MRILFLSHATILGNPIRVGSHHIASAMASMGHEVTHLSPPVPSLCRWISDRVLRIFVPPSVRARRDLAIGGLARHGRLVELACFATLPNSMRLRLGPTHGAVRLDAWLCWRRTFKNERETVWDVVFVDKATMAPLLEWLPYRSLVYRPTDDYVGFEGPRVRDFESFLIGRCDSLSPTSLGTMEALERDLGLPSSAVVLENGRDPKLFERIEAKRSITPHRDLIYLGAIDERLDLDLVEASAERHPEWRVALAGPVGENQTGVMNLEFVGAVSQEEIPGFLRSGRVGLLPLARHTANESRAPIKLYEYAAAGLPVVLPSWFRVPSDFDERYLFRYSGSGEFDEAVGRALKAGPELSPLLAGRTWDEVAYLLLERCGVLSHG